MLRLENLHFSIDEKKILNGISTHFAPCKIHGIIGPNGSGKSTMLKNISRVWEPQEGTIFINGKDYKSIARKELSRLVTMVPQNTTINFPISVYDIVAMGRNPHLGRFEGLKRKEREIVDWALKETHTYELKERNINELSGGEGQLAIIARALATEASLILLDEPVSELDIKHTLTIMDLLVKLTKEGRTILVSIHDLNLARRYCDTISIIDKGEIFYSGLPSEAFSEENIRNVFQVDVMEIKSDSRCFLYFHE